MADGITSNFGMALPITGTDGGTWGGVVNTNITGFIDSAFGNVLAIVMTSGDVTLTLAQWISGNRIKITGALTGNHILNLPRTDAASADAGVHAVGGNFVIDNETTDAPATGPWSITVQTTVGGSTGVKVARGSRTSLYSDGTNVWYADDSRTAKLNTNAGNPNGSVTGNAGAVNAPADVIWDRTNDILYVSTGGTNWVSVGQALPNPQGYLTPTSGTPIIAGDVVGTSTLFYTPYRGNLSPIYNGSSFAVFAVGELSIGLSGATGSAIYDLFLGVVAGTVVVGWGPSWTVGGGSVVPGSCARGTGAGSTQLQRINGILTNQFAMNLSNPGGPGSPPYAISANQGTYLGSMFVDVTAGQVSCLRSWGGFASGTGARRWGVWNAYNRSTIILQGGDATALWGYASANVWRQSNGQTANQLAIFTGLAEEVIEIVFDQAVVNQSNGFSQIGIGMNSTTSPSGYSYVGSGSLGGITIAYKAKFIQAPQLGVTNANMLENSGVGGSSGASFKGTNANMVMTARFNG